MNWGEVSRLAASVPRPVGVTLAYGTAGFRAKAHVLPSTFLRMGFLAALRSQQTGQIVGVMITASHNPVEDNGLKICDGDGGMLVQSWEKLACDVANAEEAAVADALQAIRAAQGIASETSTVYIAMDTRPSSRSLADLVVQGAQALGATVRDFGLLTTPQLHHVVRMSNSAVPGDSALATEEGYYTMLATAYKDILQGVDPAPVARGRVVFDGAHGIGAPKLQALAPFMDGLVTLEVRNGVEGPGALNDGVGAEHVQKTRTPPAGVVAAEDKGLRLASVDGDADRLVYHYFDAAGGWHLLDGDAIAALAATFFADHLRALGLEITGVPAHPHAHDGHGHAAAPTLGPNVVSVGVVQTAYANGASSKYIRETLSLPVPLAKTGVKFVHHKAMEYDIGVYFEANGHGTVLFHDSLLARLRALDVATLSAEANVALARILAASRLINQAVGDAISDAMFVEAVLTIKGWTIEQWAAMYTDLPSRQTKLAVADRNVIVTTEDETRVVTPAALQSAVDALVAAVESGRAFVRPSGTEDVVRVYAEAATPEAADRLALDVAKAAFVHAGGVGAEPAKL